ncbi:MAG: glycosyltransferase family 39 protein, partial [Actinobacteria bacterium]|nr:glycosyltransferase family 39 protein [Actinomycetota bacterium]
MKHAWRRLDAFVPTRRAAILLFVLATAGFWFESLGWPLAKGRDTWDYLAYYLQLFDSEPPLESLQVFRTPITPLVLGVPLDLGGAVLLEVVLGILYAISIVAWSVTALTFGRLPALLTAVLLLVYPAYATLYHQASSDAIFATGLALWALGLARALRGPSGWWFGALGAGIAVLVLIRPANQVLLPLALAPLLVPVAWRRRLMWSGACVAAAVGVLGVWTVHNAARYDETSVARGGRAWVPFLRVFLADGTISPENGDASRRLADLIEGEVLAKEP